MKKSHSSQTLVTGLALFAMFFGAGNVVFPLLLGRFAGDSNGIAILGLLLTAVIIPFGGVIAMALYKGNYLKFFFRTGRVTGTLLILLVLALIGPLAGIPRTISLSASMFDYAVTPIELWWFNAIACLLIFLCAIKKSRLVLLVGYVLTPLLLIFLFLIIGAGLWTATAAVPMDHSAGSLFLHGLKEGYNTMDLLAALFFSTIIVNTIRSRAPIEVRDDTRYLARTVAKASILGATLLALIYTGMSYVSAFHSQDANIESIGIDQLLAAIAFTVLGKNAGIIASLITSLACLTTALTLTAVFADMLRKHILSNIGYVGCVIVTLVIAYTVSLLGFAEIIRLIAPVLIITYPVYITLCVFNIGHRLWNINTMKVPMTIVFVLSLGAYLFF